jgi:hypothetical protein
MLHVVLDEQVLAVLVESFGSHALDELLEGKDEVDVGQLYAHGGRTELIPRNIQLKRANVGVADV